MFDGYSQLLLKRDRHLTFALEGTLGTAIFSDPSDYGVDLAIRKVFASHQPGIRRWEQLQSQNTRWLTCKTKVNEDRQASHAVHLNLLDGTLRVDGQLLGGLPHVIRHSPILRRIFRDVYIHCIFDLSGYNLLLFYSKASSSLHRTSQEWTLQH